MKKTAWLVCEAVKWRGGEATNMNEGGGAGEKRGGDARGGGTVGQRHGMAERTKKLCGRVT
jgi:hypothetical protein